MTPTDRAAYAKLLETGILVDFEVTKTQIHEGPDAAEFSMEIQLRFPPDPETEECDLRWGAFGFLFIVGAMSFADARPREASVIDYTENDIFQLGDLIACLRWDGHALTFRADYIRGRRMKTDVVLRTDGTGKLVTSGRGKAAVLWLERLKGNKTLQLVPK